VSNNDRIKRLLEKYQTNTLSAEEYQEFLALMAAPGALDTVDELSKEDWKESKRLLRQIETEAAPDQPVRRPLPAARLMWSVAASVALLITAFLLWPESHTAKAITYKTGYGETRTILLPDSSSVLLNANSRIVWDSDWKKKKKRTLLLDGEAFFNVKKKDKIAFVVQANPMKVSVLGTTFNLRSRKGHSSIFLQSGKVNLEIPELKQKTLAMTPGNAVVYNSSKRDLRIEPLSSLNKSASWVDGMLEFENAPVGEVLEHLEGLYGKKFVPEDNAILKKRMDLSLPYSNWNLIRNALEISLGVKFTERRDTILVQ
jgi:transmembrane sensor